ncbi:unnamed protein product [Ilex paraguariensis]|uniref:Protein ABIL2-like n=1 Tax=Ilex paraguariensis TaxID=185542 RepID=A0ABC8REB7_9AQUA
MVETLKDYLTKALVSTVDHLGSVAYKVNNFLDEKVNEVSETKLRFSCIEQRLRACQQFVDQGGHSQQSFLIKTPKYYKRYTVPGNYFLLSSGEAMPAISNTKSMHNSSRLCPEYDLNPTKKAVQATTMKVESPFRKGLSSTESPSNPATFSFTRVLSTKETGTQEASPLRFSLKRSGSLVKRSNTPSRNDKQWNQFPSEPQRSVSMCIHPERDRKKEIQPNSKRSKSFFKALLSVHRSRKEDVPYWYRDGY